MKWRILFLVFPFCTILFFPNFSEAMALKKFFSSENENTLNFMEQVSAPRSTPEKEINRSSWV